MNCKHVQELLPLYVGRDLAEKSAQMVTAHVQSCAECAGSADEYRETRQLLQQFAPPPVSEAVYAGIRQRVLRGIEKEPTAPGLARLLDDLFRPRLRWAVATALLLAVCVSAFYYVANRANDRRTGQQLAESGGTVERPTSPSRKERDGLQPASADQNRGPVQGLTGRTRPSQRRKGAGAHERTRPGTLNTAETRAMTAEAFPKVDGLAEPDAVPSLDPIAPEKTLRVEMQTNDPNIRIIWFTPQPTKQDSPNKFSKGI